MCDARLGGMRIFRNGAAGVFAGWRIVELNGTVVHE